MTTQVTTVPSGGSIVGGFKGEIDPRTIRSATDLASALCGPEQAWGRRTLWETAKPGDEVWFYQSVAFTWMMFIRGDAYLQVGGGEGGEGEAGSARAARGDAKVIAWAMQLACGLCGFSTTLDANPPEPDSRWDGELPGKRVVVLRFN